MKNMKTKITMEQMACSKLGRRHDQSLYTLLVTYTTSKSKVSQLTLMVRVP